MKPNRIVALVTAATGLGAAVFLAASGADWSTTGGVLGGLAVVFGVANRWLIGWQAYEGRRARRE